ncbi:hypothetical protein [Rosistilla oblonga]|uniref:hypothetical protein n=1 Tax=Rosistilla oblonga TaxID=2527990 RepID=UPI00119E6C6A|nr:hypothetical protein [Rosistilla oblonga]
MANTAQAAGMGLSFVHGCIIEVVRDQLKETVAEATFPSIRSAMCERMPGFRYAIRYSVAIGMHVANHRIRRLPSL